MENFLCIQDAGKNELEEIYRKTESLKENPREFRSSLRQKTLLMLFEKPSTRTRISFEAGMKELGGDTVFLSGSDSQLSRGESLKDTAEVLSRYVDGVMARMYEHEKMTELEAHSEIPVINGLTDLFHPCQALSDFYTLREKNINDPVAYIGDGNNVAHSLIEAAKALGRELRVATPAGFSPDEKIIDGAGKNKIELIDDPSKAVEGARAVYTDVWQSMGEEEKDLSDFKGFQINQELMSKSEDAVFMHCLPAHRGEEVAPEVIDGDNSIVYDQAENRKHVQKALLIHLLGGD